MKKIEFMTELSAALVSLPPEERTDILSDFEEHFATAMAGGKTEQEVAEELGSPREIAGQYVSELPPPPPRPGPMAGERVGQSLLAAAALIIFDLIFGLWIFVTIYSVWLALWATVLSIFAASLALLLSPLALFWFHPIPWAAGMLFGLALLGLTGLMTIGMIYLSKWLFKGTVAFGRLHVNIIKGGTSS